MGWTISVGTAGAAAKAVTTATAAARGRKAQALSIDIDAHGLKARVTVFPNADRTTLGDAGAMPAWQAQRVWQNVLSTLVGTE